MILARFSNHENPVPTHAHRVHMPTLHTLRTSVGMCTHSCARVRIVHSAGSVITVTGHASASGRDRVVPV